MRSRRRRGGGGIDWKTINRRANLLELMRETGGFSEGQLKGSDGFDCPRHPGSSHAKTYAKHNCVMCWADSRPNKDGVHVSVIDWYAHHYGLDPATAARELADRYGIPMLDADEDDGADPEVIPHHVQEWRRCQASGLSPEGEDWLVGMRGFPRAYIRELARKKMVASHAKKAVHTASDGDAHRDYRTAVGFPIWGVIDPAAERMALDDEWPAAVWWRFLDPPLNEKGKPDKDRRNGKTPGAFFTACDWGELLRASTVYICESVLKGLAVDVALRGADVAAELQQAVEVLANNASSDGREDLQKRVIELRGRLADIKNRGAHLAWISVLSAGGAKDLPEILQRIFGGRQRRPSIRIALDNDEAATANAERAYRELTAAGWEVLIIEPPRGVKDWDDMLKKSGGDDIRSRLRETDQRPLLAPGARSEFPGKFIHRRTRLMAEVETGSGENRKTDFVKVADFVLRGVTKWETFDWGGTTQQASVFAVHACSRMHANGSLHVRERWIAEDEFSCTETWSKVGTVFSQPLLRHYISDAKDMVWQTKRCVPIIGLMRDPDNEGRFMLVDGATRSRLNQTYKQSIDTCYDARVDWSGAWAGARDQRQAVRDGRKVLEILGKMFGPRPVALTLVYWSVGTLLKVVTRNYPHAVVVGQRGSGKSTMLRALGAALGLHSATLDDWDTDYRAFSLTGNHTFPVVADEISRVSERRIPKVQGLFNQSFDAGENTMRYGRDHFPVTMAASLLMVGQDTISDNDSKQLSLSISKADAQAGIEPDINAIPRFPWGMFGRWLCDELGADSRRHLERWEQYVFERAPRGVGDRSRFSSCWARLLWARELVLRFLDLHCPTDPADADQDPECKAIMRLMLEAAGQSMDAGEALDMMRAYAAIVATDPDRHPVTMVKVGKPDEDGAWFVPSAVLHTLAKNNQRFAIRDARRFMEALRAEGLFGEPEEPGKEWEGGHWKDGKPDRKKVPHRIAGKTSRQWSFLLPVAVLERFLIDFPDRFNESDNTGSPPGDGRYPGR